MHVLHFIWFSFLDPLSPLNTQRYHCHSLSSWPSLSIIVFLLKRSVGLFVLHGHSLCTQCLMIFNNHVPWTLSLTLFSNLLFQFSLLSFHLFWHGQWGRLVGWSVYGTMGITIRSLCLKQWAAPNVVEVECPYLSVLTSFVCYPTPAQLRVGLISTFH